jgi:FtsP/CotA-like multicopper oxidase with cupredoxin domain
MPDAMTLAASWTLRALRHACGLAVLGAALAASAGEHKVIALSLAKGVVRDVPNNTVRVKQGDDVELRWSSDRPVTLHLHGYEIEAQVTPGKAAAMSFNAKIRGRFPVHEHAEGSANHRPVLYLEVYP